MPDISSLFLHRIKNRLGSTVSGRYCHPFRYFRSMSQRIICSDEHSPCPQATLITGSSVEFEQQPLSEDEIVLNIGAFAVSSQAMEQASRNCAQNQNNPIDVEMADNSRAWQIQNASVPLAPSFDAHMEAMFWSGRKAPAESLKNDNRASLSSERLPNIVLGDRTAPSAGSLRLHN